MDIVDNVIILLTNQVILGVARATYRYTVYTDEYDSQLGCVLRNQQKDTTTQQIGYLFCTPTSAAETLRTTRKERSAAV